MRSSATSCTSTKFQTTVANGRQANWLSKSNVKKKSTPKSLITGVTDKERILFFI
jgi:hypothetical protein